MLRYNTQQKRLILPEYGRVIQDMVDHCLTIEDRDERTRCAYTIVESMAHLFPELKSGGQYHHKLWDHLAIMSGFELDIDYPCEIIGSGALNTRPEPMQVEYKTGAHLLYGHRIEDMIDIALDMEPGEERDVLSKFIAAQMKKIIAATHPDAASDERVFADLAHMSGGAIRLSADTCKLHEYIVPAPVATKKKKKKK